MQLVVTITDTKSTLNPPVSLSNLHERLRPMEVSSNVTKVLSLALIALIKQINDFLNCQFSAFMHLPTKSNTLKFVLKVLLFLIYCCNT